MRIIGLQPRFGWGGDIPLPKQEAFILPAPQEKEPEDAFVRDIAARLSQKEDTAPRFVVLTDWPVHTPDRFELNHHRMAMALSDNPKMNRIFQNAFRSLEREYSSYRHQRSLETPLYALLNRIGRLLGLRQLEDLKAQGQSDKVAIKEVTTWPDMQPVRQLQKGKHQLVGIRFGPFVKPGDGYLEIADIRQFCEDKGIKEDALYTPIPWHGMQMKPDYANEINDRYTVRIDAGNAPGKSIAILMNTGDKLYCRFMKAPGENMKLTGQRPYDYYTLDTTVFDRDELNQSLSQEDDDLIELTSPAP